MKKLLTFALCALLLLGVCLFPAAAQTVAVLDEAGVLSAAEEETLRAEADAYTAQTGYNVVFLTVPAITEYGYDTYDYGVAYARMRLRQLCGSADGVIFLYVEYDPYSESGKGCYAIATEGACRAADDGRVLDPMLSDMKAGRFADGFRTGLAAFADEIVRTNAPREKNIVARIVISALVGLAAGLTVALLCKRRMNTVRKKKNAAAYTVNGSFRLTQQRDIYLYSRVTAVRVQSSNSRGGGGGGSHGGGGRRL